MFFDILNDLYAFFYKWNFIINKRYSPFRIISNCAAKVLRLIVQKNLWLMDSSVKPLEMGSNVIVSITSFPKRFSKLDSSIKSILRQTVMPEKIVVNLTQPECPKGLEDLPPKLRNLQKYGVEFVFRPDNLKPHGKYFYTLQEYPEKLIVTMDDDILYRKNAIENLLMLHQQNPNAVCARITRKICVKEGVVQPYNRWSLFAKEKNAKQSLALGFGGVLYPAKIFEKSNLFNKKDICNYCLNADDLWLKANELLLEIPVVSGKFQAPDIALESSNFNGLSAKNVAETANDSQWIALNKAFDIDRLIVSK